MANYTKQWSTATPGYLIFLIDQSLSMKAPWTDEKSYAEYTAEVINRTINELIATNAAGETVKNRVFVTLIGYSGIQNIQHLRSDYLSSYADEPLRIERKNRHVENGEGGFITMEEELPIFIEPTADGLTPMAGAFALAKKLILRWIEKKNDNPVPIVINVSDGLPEGADPVATQQENTAAIKEAKEIMEISTLDGNPLIFNVHIGNSGNEIQFPEYPLELNNDNMAKFLFEISSRVPDVYKKAAKDMNLNNIGANSRGFISNASPENFINFINFGSSGGNSRSSL